MKKWLLAFGGILISTAFYAQNLIEITNNNVIDVKNSFVATADLNNDGKKDLYISGINSSGTVVNAFYLNNGYGTFVDNSSVIANVTPLSHGSAKFADVDGDGDMDLLISGKNASNQSVTQLYIFNGTTYSASANSFDGIYQGNADFIDYDGDGDLDIFISGENISGTAISKFYTNNGSASYTAANFPAIIPHKKGGFAFGNFRGTGATKDLFLTGITQSDDTTTHIYRYNGTEYVLVSDTLLGYASSKVKRFNLVPGSVEYVIVNGIETGNNALVSVFVFDISGYFGIATIATDYANGDFTFNDFNQDGRPDFTVTGKSLINSQLKSDLKLSSTFTNMIGSVYDNDASTILEPLFNGDITSFDFENDGDIDLIITGENANGESDTRLYRNINICTATSYTQVVNSCNDYLWIDGNTYTSNNSTATHVIPYGNIWGCDSTVTLNLTIKKTYYNENAGSVCDTLTLSTGQKISSSVSGYEYVKGLNVAGCDSIHILNVVIKHSTYLDQNVSECNEYKWLQGNGITYTSSQNNVLFYLGVNSQGCDSLARLNLVIKHPVERVDNVTACMQYTWVDGNTYTNDNSTATFHVGTASNGCDSIAKLNLVISNIVTGVDEVTACDPYTWIDGNTYYGTINTVTYTTTSVFGCDSIVTLNLTMDTINTILTFVNGVPNVNQPNATYQWINCDENMPVVGQTGTSFTPWYEGNFACVITYRDCQDTTNCFHSAALSVEKAGLENYISVYPNPSKGNVTIKVASLFEWTKVIVYNAAGQIVKQPAAIDSFTNELSLTNLSKGVYLVKIETDKGSVQERLVIE